MNETAAREVVLVRAIELRDGERALMSDADRDWATRAAAEVEGEDAPAERFVARRARLALERVRRAHPAVDRALRALVWHGWIGPVLAAAAFALGAASNQLGPAQRVNVLAFPLLALLAWNVVMYGVLALRVAAGWLSGARPGPVRRWVARLAQGMQRRSPDRAGLQGALSAFTADWAKLAAGITTARAASVLHVAAAAFAVGAVAGMYVRGLAFEYRAGWESTFLDADRVRALLDFALAPGQWLTGLRVPDADALQRIRFTAGGSGENAAPWIHLYAATAALVIVVPRAVLAIANGLMARHWTARFPLPLDDAYYVRLLRALRRGAATVRVVPYSYQVPPAAVQGLAAIVTRVLGPRAEISYAEAVAYGDESAIGELARCDVLIALYSAAATPERENQAAFAAALAARTPPGTTLVALVDEAGFRRRFAQQPQRVEERAAAWREALAPLGVEPLFVDLTEPDLAAAEAAFSQLLDRAAEKAGAAP